MDGPRLMAPGADPLVRPADEDDVPAVCAFGQAHIRPHYAPLIGASAADEQVRRWWNPAEIGAAVARGVVVVAEADGELVGVGQRGRSGDDHVVYKLYVHPGHRGRGVGRRLLAALTRQLPADADRLCIEHFAANEGAGRFYEREGFVVERVEPGPTEALDVVWRARRLDPAPRRWVAARVAHPVRDLARSSAFYGGLLALPARGGFAGHDGYDGCFFALPGGGELELTTGPVTPRPGTDDDLLVLYASTLEEARRTAADLESAGVPSVPAANPYWDRWGRTLVDPDGYRVVIAATEPERLGAAVHVEAYTGDRDELRSSFALAEDSAPQLDSYLHTGRVLVAVDGQEIVGHLQLVDTELPGQSEIKNMAVRPDRQGRGIGARLVRAAVELVAAEAGTALLVATAAAGTGTLRFYQRQGFRLRSVDRDAFTPATGYPPGSSVDGIELRDRVWLDRPVSPTA